MKLQVWEKKAVRYWKSTNSKAASVAIPDTVTVDGITYKVTAIAEKAFKGNKKITRIKIGNNVAEIGNFAFHGCRRLRTVTFGKNVKMIGEKAFYKCTSLQKISIPGKVTKIGKQSFYGCNKLKNITIKTTKLNTRTMGKETFKGISRERQ